MIPPTWSDDYARGTQMSGYQIANILQEPRPIRRRPRWGLVVGALVVLVGAWAVGVWW